MIAGMLLPAPFCLPAMAQLPHLPVGIENYKKLRQEAPQGYVDKTERIAALVDRNHPGFVSDHIFLARPRRFGKTLLVSLLETLFQGDRAAFTGTWLYDNWNWDTPPHPVLRLNMGRFRDVHSAAAFRTRLQRYLASLDTGLPLAQLSSPIDLEPQEQWQSMIQSRAADGPVVVLIDEYDTPVTANLDAVQEDVLQDILRLLRGFYGVIKDESAEGHIHRAFVTGISRFARTGLFSGANQFTDVSSDSRFADILGFTDAELGSGSPLAAYLEPAAHNMHYTVDQMHKALADHYNGYRFAHGGEAVYNPWSLLQCLDSLQSPVFAAQCREAGLPNRWAESGTPRFLFALLARANTTLDDVRQSATPTEAETVIYNVHHPDPVGLFYQTGYLTRKPGNRGQDELDFPNREVEHTFRHSLTQWQQTAIGVYHPRQESRWTTHWVQALDTPDPMHLARHCTRWLRSIPSLFHSPAPRAKTLQDYETLYRTLFYGVLQVLPGLSIGEVPAGQGRMDLCLLCPIPCGQPGTQGQPDRRNRLAPDSDPPISPDHGAWGQSSLRFGPQRGHPAATCVLCPVVPGSIRPGIRNMGT